MVEKISILHLRFFLRRNFISYSLKNPNCSVSHHKQKKKNLENPPITPLSFSLIVLFILYCYSLLACSVYTFFLHLLCSLFQFLSPGVNHSLSEDLALAFIPSTSPYVSDALPPFSLFPRTRLGVCIGSTFPRSLRHRSILLRDSTVYEFSYKHFTVYSTDLSVETAFPLSSSP